METNRREDPGIGARVRAARARVGWSREELAFHSGISWSGLAQVESGRRRNLRPDTLAALAGALGVTIDYLVRAGPAAPPMLDHKALIYADDGELLDAAGPFLAAGVERSEAVLAVTTRSNIDLLRGALGADARHVEFVESAMWFDAPASTLAAYKGFANAKLAAGAPWIRILGEPIWQGSSKSEVREWTRYESLFNLVFATWPMTVVCPYDAGGLKPEIVSQARLTHPNTIAQGQIAASPGYVDPDEFVLEPGS